MNVDAVVEDALAALRRTEPPEAARAAAVEALAGPGLQPRPRARALLAKGIAEHRLDRWAQALRDLVEALTCADEAGDTATRVEILRATGVVHAWRGQHGQAVLNLTLALADAAVLGERTLLGDLLGDLGRANLEMRRYAHAHAFFLRQQALVAGNAGAGDARAEARLRLGIVQALVGLGRLEEAAEDAARVLDEVVGAGLGYLAFVAARDLAVAHLRAGRLDPARDAIARAGGLAGGEGGYERLALDAVEAELSAATGAPDADQRLAAVVQACAERDLVGPEVDARLLQADVLLARGKPGEAARTLRAALARAHARGLQLLEDMVREAITRLDVGEGLAEEQGRDLGLDGAAGGDGYVLLERLGGGQFGAVFRAFDPERGREVALKRMHGLDAYEGGERRRLLDSARLELEAASRVRHPGVARVLAVGETDGGIYVVQDFVSGAPLRVTMGETRAPGTVAAALRRLALSLAAMHAAGVVHRDLKPDNILVPQPDRPVIVDFGIAALAGRAQAASRGTEGYAAPEQWAGEAADARADLYALGAIAFEWLVGRLPEVAARRRLFARRVLADADARDLGTAGPALAGLVTELLDPDPARRPPSAQDVADRLQALLRGS